MRLRRTGIAGGALALTLAALANGSNASGPPYSPEQSMAMLKLEPGFRVEPVASEPDIQSPVAMDIDEDGRIFVVEMPGYPLDVSPSGRVKLLEDTDGDGRVDRSTVYADRLVLPTGVMRYKRGILVTSPPDLLYFEDLNGDGKADRREVVMTGFARTNPQHTVNHPVYGLDNWVYLAHSGASEPVIYRDLFGDTGRDLTFQARPELPGLDSRGRGVRLKPDDPRAEGLSSHTQFGNAFDVYGRFFAHNNSIHVRHEVIAARYLERNPHLVLSSAMADISDHGNDKIMPITHGARFDLLTEAGQFTSACALTIYNGGAFPSAYEGASFVAEPVHNLVHRDVLSPKGATFSASRGRPDMEFLASTDSWFRPVNLYVGPDGALYFIDYYRPYIEHPEWGSSDLQKNPAILSTGMDHGRIYRIVSTGATETAGGSSARPRLGSADDNALVAALGHRNGWWRRTAQRLLVTNRRRGAVPALERLVEARPSAHARLHALWTLEGLDRLDVGHVLQALDDEDLGVRENGIILAERWLTDPRIGEALLSLAKGATASSAAAGRGARLRFQLLATLGSLDTPASHAAQERLLLADIDDEWMQVAALSASSDRAAAWFARALDPASGLTARESPGRARFFERLGGIVAARKKPEELAKAIAAVTAPPSSAAAGDWWRAALLDGVAQGVEASRGDRKRLGANQSALLALATGNQPRLRRAAVTLLGVSGIEPGAETGAATARAARIAADRTTAEEARVDAIALLALADATANRALFESVIDSSEPDAVQMAGINALRKLPEADKTVPAALLARWGTLTPSVRTAAATVILARSDGAGALLEALRAGTVKPWMLNFWQKRRLIMHRDERLRAAARTLLEESPEARARTVARYAAALGGRGNPARGKEVFANACSMCHQVDGGGGVAMGPDLATVRHRPPAMLLADILEPSRSIAQHYETYQVETTSGATLVGVIGDQSPAAIGFRQGPGQSVTLRRSDIRRMQVVPQSTMPEGLDQQITPEQMADLLAFLTTQPMAGAGAQEGAGAEAGRPATTTLPDAKTSSHEAIAAALLDDRHDRKLRDGLASEAAPRAPEVVRALVTGMPDDEDEEYRRIPWIWRVAVAAGRAKDEPALRKLMDDAVPREGQPLRDWQAVVLGGGVVMGLSQAGAWPRDVIAPWLSADTTLDSRWTRALDLAIVMADNPRVRNGTRYDALRMLAVLPWDRAGVQLVRYLSADVDAELQAGAIGGLSDLQDDRAAAALIRHIEGLVPANRRHAIDALLRTGARRTLLRDAISRGVVRDEWLTPEQRRSLNSVTP